MNSLIRELSAGGISACENLPLSKHSSFRIGGNADLAVFPTDEEQLIRSVMLCRERKTPYCVIGNASNVLFPDDGIRGAVIFTGRMRGLTPLPDGFCADCGVPLAALANAAMEASLTGCEFAQGIPGTVGGAVVMNAGAYGGEMAQIVRETAFFDCRTGARRTVSGEAHRFGYRRSVFSDDPDRVILSVRMTLAPGIREEISERMRTFAACRREKQPLSCPSAGSVFRRPEGHFAGKLIEDCGLKGRSVGGAEVSTVHAGFIVNRGGATARDVRELIAIIRRTVEENTGVRLECEIRFAEDLIRTAE